MEENQESKEFIYELSKYTNWEYIKDINEFRVIKKNDTYIALSVISLMADDEEYKGETTVKIVVEAILYFDGFRHIYIGDKGYLYYQNTSNLIELLSFFDEINKSCKDYN